LNELGILKYGSPSSGEWNQEKIPARVIGMNREIYRLGFAGNETEKRGGLSGKLRETLGEGEFPVVGDWVLCREEPGVTLITDILPRRSLISRKTAGIVTREQPLAANIDLVGIVQGLDGGRNFSGRALERYLTIAWNSGAVPFLVLNKADLCEEPGDFEREAELFAPGVDIFITSAEEGRGMDELSRFFAQKTIILIGPSGVGKSALTNALSGREIQKTGENRDSDKRGRHTTTTSRLTALPCGGWLIDSPGLKEIQLWGDQEGLEETFPDIDEYARDCHYRDCRHEGEPGCSVQKALEKGYIDGDRYNSYLELRRELAYLESRKTERGRSELRRKGKEFGRYIKNMKKGKAIY
jgi:ribosome biogenesis GTPase / thiamine phosphate phosphatase